MLCWMSGCSCVGLLASLSVPSKCASLSCVRVSHLAMFILLNNCSHFTLPDLEIYHAEYILHRISPAVPRRTYILSDRRIADPPVPSAGGRAHSSLLLRMDLRIAQKSWLRARSSANRLANWSRSCAAASANWMNKNCSVQLSLKILFFTFI